MFLTLVQYAKKAKSKHILVQCQSMVTHHTMNRVRERQGDKLEFMFFDPCVQQMVLYREKKKLRSIDWIKELKPFKLTRLCY